MIASDPEENGWTQSNEELMSPPRQWPTSFKANKTLSSFLNKTIKGTKARLTSKPPDDIAADAASSVQPLSPVDSAFNATRAHKILGWPVLAGFAIYELKGSPNIFVARRFFWNLHPRNIWVDLTPRDAHLSEILLVEADIPAAYIRAGLNAPKMPALVVTSCGHGTSAPAAASLSPTTPSDAATPKGTPATVSTQAATPMGAGAATTPAAPEGTDEVPSAAMAAVNVS